MKIALIPPIPMLQYYGLGRFHLLLTHLMENEAYVQHYHQQRHSGAYLVLDNSAHEKGQGEDAASLMGAALKLEAQEVVVPDVLFDGPGTVESCTKAHEVWFEAGHPGMVELNPALMYVPQGQTEEEWHQCMVELIRIHIFCALKHDIRRDLVLGISKDYEMWDGGLKRLLKEYVVPIRERLFRVGVHMPVHLLGWGRDLWALAEISKAYPWLRSTDSAKPFVYALHGVQLDKRDPPPKYPGRPDDYFSRKMTKKQMESADWNIRVFAGMA